MTNEPLDGSNTQPDADAPMPAPARRGTAGTRKAEGTQRFTVDLDREQRRTLSVFAAEWEVDKSTVVRTLLYLLEADPSLRERLQQELRLNSA